MLDTDKAVPNVYKAGTTLVGLKLVSFFNKDYFFQYLLLHLPHTRISELQHPNHENIPLKLQWYAAAVQHCGEFWQSKDAISSFLHDQGNREHFIQTALAYVDTLKDMFFLWQLQVLSVEAIDMPYESAVREFSLDPQQLCVHRHVVKSLNERASAYSSFLPSANTEPASSSNSESNSDFNSDFETDMENEQQVLLLHGNFDHRDATTNDWTKPILVTGKPGCGKSHAIESIVHSVSSEDALILIAAPTGFLASVFRFNAPEHVVCDTVHASFHFPVETDVLPKINWELSKYDLIIIDEISMIPDIIFNHILKTFNVLLFRPIVLLSGDAG
jgi:DNA replication protein DnaC